MAEISVIIPVYNVENYLEQCLDSVINQTFKDIEIICVNDGSTDNSRKILEEYKNKDSRIIIVDKENGGLSSARNSGMNVATSNFLSFIDSDDWVELTMLEKLYKNITSLNTDISICAVHQFDETTQKMDDSVPYFTLELFNNSFDNKIFSYEDTKSILMDVPVMAWNKLYRKSFIDKCNSKFPEGLIWEDGPFFFSIYFKTKRVSIVRDFLYYYRINRKGSIIQKGGRQFIDILDVVELMYNSIKDLSCFDEIKYEFYYRKIDDIVYRYDLIDTIYKDDFSKKLKTKKFLFDKKTFDPIVLENNFPFAYRRLLDIADRFHKLKAHFNKYKVKWMYKVMQILYTEENIYYLKYKKLILRLKKRANLYDIWYENDRIFVVLFMKIKFSFKFEYSKLEKK
ncbi:MAG: glycosyltransferase [Candidatus Gastranaerophilales bacterium]|nr:glycosyltransferase [Candidatus Gastranaerophilales bacterium]